VRNPVYRPQWMIVLTSVVVAGMSVAGGETFPAFFAERHPALAGQTLSASGVPALHAIVDSGRNADLRWSDFTAYKTEVARTACSEIGPTTPNTFAMLCVPAKSCPGSPSAIRNMVAAGTVALGCGTHLRMVESVSPPAL
jgi:hypothetical protein